MYLGKLIFLKILVALKLTNKITIYVLTNKMAIRRKKYFSHLRGILRDLMKSCTNYADLTLKNKYLSLGTNNL